MSASPIHRSEPSALAGGSFCLIGLAHGSRHPAVRATIESLMAEAGRRLEVPARAAFLDLTDPDLDAVADECARAGHQQAVVVPLLFTQAFHATIDVPEAVRSAAEHSGLRLHLAEILGTGDDVLEVLEVSAAQSRLDPDAAILLYAVGSSRPEANAAVEDLAGRLAVRRGRPARAGFGTVDPRADTVLATMPEPLAILPLFLAPGLLLDPMARKARDHGWGMADPLGDLAAGLVVDRYQACLAVEPNSVGALR